MKTVSFHNLGCKVNSYEMEVMQQKFRESGYDIVPFDMPADVCVINTCTVTNIADRKSRQMIHRAKKLNPGAVIVAVGCYVQARANKAGAQSPDVFSEEEGADIYIGNNRKNEIVRIVEEHIERNREGEHKTAGIVDIAAAKDYEDMTLARTQDHTRVYIKVQDGCDQYCTFCAIPYVRGHIRSRRPEDVYEEVRRLAKEGYKEFVVTGIHLSSYGLDFEQGEGAGKIAYNRLASEEGYNNTHLLKLAEGIASIPGVERIRLGSLEPRVITEEFLSTLVQNKAVCPHFHLSLQSGCDETLVRMNRRYTASEYRKKVELIRRFYDLPAITTDIITGFPGEDKEEFGRTVEFVESIGFFETHIFKYSKRDGTVAAGMPGQNTEAVKAKRSDVLEEINKRNRLAFCKAHIGRCCEVLAEETKVIDGITYMVGHTRDYVMAAVDASVKEGEIVAGEGIRMLNDEILYV